jgi:hypothetical protein
MQIRTDEHTSGFMGLKEQFEINDRSHDKEESTKQFFKLFHESTLEGSEAAALDMKKIVKRSNKDKQKFLLFHSLQILIRCSNSDMLSWPNSPLLVLLQFVDPNIMTSFTPLHLLADLLDPSDYLTHVNQLILAEQLIKHGANVNAVSIPHGETPLHSACNAYVVTNLDLVELLLVKGANPNAQSQYGKTPLMMTTTGAPGAAKFLLKWPTTDFNTTLPSGESFIHLVRWIITLFTNQTQIALLGDLDQLLLQQWRDIEEMLAEKGAH